MPPKRRIERRRRPDLEQLTRGQRKHLESGQDYFGPALDEDTAREAWAIHGEAVVADYIQRHPGHRPWGWWAFEHRREPPVIDTGIRRENALQMYKTERPDGVLHQHIWFYGDAGTVCYRQEQVDYLDEHDVLTDAERQALGRLKPCG